ncbi:polyphosphate kinase 2 family protein [Sphingobium boeckii]|uniref:Polyphosphate kinase 2 (PPK2 family) n=1 Tax=Sphingobium boeckii TaxID=1082345 RepID=A0A7W9EFQ3_9SPHN|nr:polyphosphate kinase [Sphingobium boeckii]MBB5687349.1 polyphosphate kinase 2 (PPK2 family) [Sphingobium boeckii]
MTIDLSDYEKGEKFEGDYDAALKAAQERVSRVQAAYISQGRRAILVFEGWDAAGKGGAIGRLTSELDPRYFEVWPISAPTQAEKERHFLWRFWTKLPGAGDIAIFDRSWYGRVLVERVEGFATDAEWKRGFDEINEFEAQQKDSGTVIAKLFLHITQEEQDKRLIDRLDHPWKRWKTGKEDFRNRARRADYLAAMHDMFKQTNTRWAPWKVIDANSKKAARIAVMMHVADRLEAAVKMDPPEIDPEVLALAKDALGYAPKAEN